MIALGTRECFVIMVNIVVFPIVKGMSLVLE